MPKKTPGILKFPNRKEELERDNALLKMAENEQARFMDWGNKNDTFKEDMDACVDVQFYLNDRDLMSGLYDWACKTCEFPSWCTQCSMTPICRRFIHDRVASFKEEIALSSVVTVLCLECEKPFTRKYTEVWKEFCYDCYLARKKTPKG